MRNDMTTWYDDVNDKIMESLHKIWERMERIATIRDSRPTSMTSLRETMIPIADQVFKNPTFNMAIRSGFNDMINSDDYHDASGVMLINETLLGCEYFVGSMGYVIETGRDNTDAPIFVPGRVNGKQSPETPLGLVARIAEYLQMVNELEGTEINTYQSAILLDKLSTISMGVFDVLYIILDIVDYSKYIAGINDAIKKGSK